MILTEKTADRKVSEMQQQGIDIEWDGWTIHTYNPFDSAYMRSNGVFRNGQWQLRKSFELNENGKWNINGVKFNKQ